MATSATDAVWVDVLPSLANFRKELESQLKGAMPKIPAPEVEKPTIPQPDTRGWMRQFADGIKSQASQVYRQFDQLGGEINRRIGTGLKVGAAAGGAIIAAGLWGGLQRALDREDATLTFRRMGLSDQNIKQLQDSIDQALQGTPITNPEGFALAGRFLAQGFDEADIPGIISTIADMSTVGNRSFQEMSDVMVAAAGAGRITAAELNRLGDVPLTRVAEELGMTEREMRDMAASGELTAETFLDAFASIDAFSGAAKDPSTRVAFSNLRTAVSSLGEQFLSPLLGEGGAAQRALLSLREHVSDLGPFVADLGQRFADWLIPAVQRLGEWVAGTLVPAMQSAARWFSENRETLGRLVRAAAPVAGIGIGIASSVNLMTRAFGLFGRSPALMLLGALATALMYAWQNSETFRTVVTTVFEAVGAVASWLWSSVLQPVFGFIGAAWEVTLTAIQAAWTGVLKPVWDAVAAAGQWLWSSVLQPVWQAMQIAWVMLLDIIRAAWNNVLKPTWDAIATAASWLWSNVLSPVFGWIGAGWGQLLDGIRAVWNNILKPVWDAVASAARWLWDNALAPVFGWIGDRWDTILGGMRLVWQTVLQPVFEAVGDAVGTMRDAVGRAVDAIGGAWDGLKRLFAAPVNWVIDNVLNRFIGWINDISSRLGFEWSISLVPNVSAGTPSRPSGPPQMIGSIPEYHTGGRVGRDGRMRRPGQPLTAGEELAVLRHGELVLTEDETDTLFEIGNPLAWIGRAATSAVNAARRLIVSTIRPAFNGVMDVMDATVGRFGLPGEMAAGMARGLGDRVLDWMAGVEEEADRRIPELGPGVGWRAMWDVIRNQFPDARLTSAVRPGARTAGTGRQSYHALGRAIDVAGARPMDHPAMLAIARWIDEHYPDSTELIYSRGPSRIGGRPWTPTGITRAQHFDHVHWAFDEGGMLPPGVSTVANWTGRPEPVLTGGQWDALTDVAQQGRAPIDLTVDLGEGITRRLRIEQARDGRTEARMLTQMGAA